MKKNARDGFIALQQGNCKRTLSRLIKASSQLYQGEDEAVDGEAEDYFDISFEDEIGKLQRRFEKMCVRPTAIQ
jgi:hypothetical protein